MTDPEAPDEAQSASSLAEPLRSGADRAGVKGLGRAIDAGLKGEAISARGVLDAIGGLRGVIESLLPALIFLIVFVVTRNAIVAAIAPVCIAAVALVWRLLKREPLVSALSGLIGVAVCAAAVLLTGEGRSYFVPGFWINGAWIAAHAISLAVGWPILGLLLGFLRGSLTEWRSSQLLRRASALCTGVWIAIFAARLAVQIPLYIAAGVPDSTADSTGATAGALEALGIARLVMGVPLFALAILFTWLVLARVSAQVPVPEKETGSDP